MATPPPPRRLRRNVSTAARGTRIVFEDSFDEVDEVFQRVPLDLAFRVHGAACEAACRVIARRMTASTAFNDRSGALRRSIQAFRSDINVRIGADRYRIKDGAGAVWWGAISRTPDDAWYVRFLEYGTRHSRAREVMKRAIENTRPEQHAALVAAFRAALPRQYRP